MNMINFKKALAGCIAITSMITLASCGGDGKSTKNTTLPAATLGSEDAQTIESLLDELPDVELKNKTITWFSFYDKNPKEGEPADPAIEMFKEKYDGKIEYRATTWNTRQDDLATAVLGGDSPDFGPWDMYPVGAVSGMYQPVDDYIDYDSDLWKDQKENVKQFAIKGHNYFVLKNVEIGNVMIYNRNTINENNFDDPAELFAQGKWDWNTFKEMCVEFANRDEDKFALDGWWYQACLMAGTGTQFVSIEDNKFKSNLDNPRIEALQNVLLDLYKADAYWPLAEKGWALRGEFGVGIGTGLTLFWPGGLYFLKNVPEKTKEFGDISSGDVMFVPVPKDPSSDIHYTTGEPIGYFLFTGAKNPEGAKLFWECDKISLRLDEVKDITLNQLKNEYGWTDELIAMNDTCNKLANEHPVFNFAAGASSDLSGIVSSIESGAAKGGKSWTETKTEWKDALQMTIDELNDLINK